MPRKPEVSATYARLVLQAGTVDAGHLLRGVNLSARDIAAREFIDAEDLTVIFRNYDRAVKDPTWTAKLGAQLHVGAHGPLGFAALCAPTLGEALDVMGDLQASRNTVMKARTCATPSHYRLELEDAAQDADLHRWMTEVVLKVVEALLASILGHPVGRNVQISLAQPKPDYAADLAACYDSALDFAQAANAIAVPLAWRQLPSPLHDESVYRVNLIKCRELIAAREQSDSAAVAVHNLLSNHFDTQMLATDEPQPPPTLEQVAVNMHLTPRTLIRRLEREGVSYRDMVNTLRRDYARRLLRDARLTVADVGEILGYREPANFGRAFRRWYGMPPAAWRRQPDD